MDEEVIGLRNVTVNYGDLPVLEDVSLSIHRHDFLGIIGPNGGGKTTLLKVILGLVKPDSGEVRVFGGDPLQNRRYIGYVPQYSLFDQNFPISVLDVVLTGRAGKALFRRYTDHDKKLARTALEMVEMLSLKDRQIGRLSGGQQQRVFIARALAAEPKVLLLDEPAAGIDALMQTEFYELLGRLRQRMAIVMVSHDITAVSVHVSKIACLNRRLFYHDSKELMAEDLEAAYQCPVELIAHGIPHRVLREH
jgi:zinc transport system ATP-binding protein